MAISVKRPDRPVLARLALCGAASALLLAACDGGGDRGPKGNYTGGVGINVDNMDRVISANIGPGPFQVAAGSHDHDAVYARSNELAAVDGAPNQPDDPVDWSQIKNVPASAISGTVGWVDTGAGLSGGPITTAGTIALDISATGGLTTGLSGGQLGLVSGIAPGQVLKWDGAQWVPAADESSAYSAGAGIQIDAADAISIADGGVTAAKLGQMGALDGEVLMWDDLLLTWTPARVTGEMIDGTSAIDGDVLVWNDSLSRWEPAAHDHDGRYYVETEVDALLAGKSDTGHAHAGEDITSGTVGTDRFSAYDDLAAEAKIGAAADQVAAGGHAHDAAYMPAGTDNWVDAAGDTMTGPLVLNSGPGDDVSIDETGITGSSGAAMAFDVRNAGAGAMELRVDGSPVWHAGNDGAGSTLDADALDGQDGAFYLDWGNLTNVPADFADGTDDDTAYGAGDGLALVGTTFNANFTASGGDNGTATTVARGDHVHDGAYYAEAEVDALLAGKSDAAHVHDARYYMETEVDALLAGKSDAAHGHDATYVNATGDAMAGDLDMSGTQRVVNLADPIAAQDAATKSYVDANVLATQTRAVSANTTLGATDSVLFVDASGGPVDVMLPPASVATVGRVYHVYKVDPSTNTVKVWRNPGDFLRGATTATTVQWQALKIIGYTPTEWIANLLQ